VCVCLQGGNYTEPAEVSSMESISVTSS
jgi:hypothetical protein